VQPADWQVTPTAYRWQAPVPSHMPVVPQVDGSWVGQRSPGSVATSAVTQVPAAPAAAQV
jgi:hypothetical protein